MADDLVMRSVYISAGVDAELRQLAHDLNITKSELIRTAISGKLKEWRGDNTRQKAAADVEAAKENDTLKQNIRTTKPRSIAPKRGTKK